MPARTTRGNPLTAAERRQHHYEETGEWLAFGDLPARGTGLANPGIPSVDDVSLWFEANWKWLLGIGGTVAVMYFLMKK